MGDRFAVTNIILMSHVLNGISAGNISKMTNPMVYQKYVNIVTIYGMTYLEAITKLSPVFIWIGVTILLTGPQI